MIENIGHIKQMRKTLGITQKELAKHSGVSQSLIAKIESDRIDPAFSKVVKIHTALQALTKQKKQKTVEEIMIKQIIKLSPTEKIKNAIMKMKKHNISQLPVFMESQVVGFISDSVILEAITDGQDSESTIDNVMEEAPPTIALKTDLDVVAQLLKQFPLVVVSEKGKAKGIVTKADFFNSLY